jgi:hypothetical protein
MERLPQSTEKLWEFGFFATVIALLVPSTSLQVLELCHTALRLLLINRPNEFDQQSLSEIAQKLMEFHFHRVVDVESFTLRRAAVSTFDAFARDGWTTALLVYMGFPEILLRWLEAFHSETTPAELGLLLTLMKGPAAIKVHEYFDSNNGWWLFSIFAIDAGDCQIRAAQVFTRIVAIKPEWADKAERLRVFDRLMTLVESGTFALREACVDALCQCALAVSHSKAKEWFLRIDFVEVLIEMAEIVKNENQLEVMKKVLFSVYCLASYDRPDVRIIITPLFDTLLSDFMPPLSLFGLDDV